MEDVKEHRETRKKQEEETTVSILVLMEDVKEQGVTAIVSGRIEKFQSLF